MNKHGFFFLFFFAVPGTELRASHARQVLSQSYTPSPSPIKTESGYANQAVLKLVAIPLFQLPKQGITGGCHHVQLPFSFSVLVCRVVRFGDRVVL